ncbi:MAG: TonB C-terminal domain-containing protein [Thiobacillaceae bacterium]|nr:TonB C-terminal domain-containing protein [Thiobacillaceae bacterium]MCX7672888.1 TonB C-terminal domain-containing protein [Thiobacillaceae bacterium]MDW8324278.1 energy transducer TonB [Burkholderiales bacterium]
MIRPSGLQYLWSGTLAVAVHLLFALGLVVGLSWRSPPHLPVVAELWSELPPPAGAVPKPAAQPEPPPPAQAKDEPDIDLAAREEQKRQQAERREQERRWIEVQEAERRQREAEQRRLEEKRREERRREDERRQQELARQQEEQRRQEEAQRRAREAARRELEAELARQLEDDLMREARQLQRSMTADALARQRVIEDYQARIRSKIQGYLRLPPNLTGNPEVVYQVRLLPDGEVLKLTLLKSSGQPAYDKQVELAILRASPLPLPPQQELAAVFREELILKFRPHEADGV